MKTTVNIRIVLLAPLLAAGAMFPAVLRADLATIYLEGGEARTVELVAAERGQVLWKNSVNDSEVQATPRSRISHVAFPTTEAWRTAEEAFESGDLPGAIRAYQAVIADPASHFYPVPGNFVSLAKARLLRVHRLRLDAQAVAHQAKVVREEFLNLPPDFRKVAPEVVAWTAAAEGDWEKVLEAVSGEGTPGPETYYLRGRALEELGKVEEAIQEYAGAYVLNFGGSQNLTREALRRSSILLERLNNPDRQGELQAQVKLYRDLFGGGSLWKGASESLAKLAGAEIETLGDAEGNMAKPESAGGVVAAESSGVVAAAPVEAREYFLPQDLEEKIFVVAEGAEEAGPRIEGGGVVKKDHGFEFNGTGGGIRIGRVDGSAPLMLFRIRFSPMTADGIVFDLNEPKKGGAGLYLKGGKMILVLDQPGRGKRLQKEIGEIEMARLETVQIQLTPNGKVNVRVGDDSQQYDFHPNGLRLSKNLVAAVGFAGLGDNENEAGTIHGGEFLPFKGSISHFSIGCGASGDEIQKREIERFGKKVRLFPEVPKPADGKGTPKAGAPKGGAPKGETPKAAPPAPKGNPPAEKGAPKGEAKGAVPKAAPKGEAPKGISPKAAPKGGAKGAVPKAAPKGEAKAKGGQ